MPKPSHASPPREIFFGTVALLPAAAFLTLGPMAGQRASTAMGTGSVEATFILLGLALPFIGIWLGIGAIEKGSRHWGLLLVLASGCVQALAVWAGMP